MRGWSPRRRRPRPATPSVIEVKPSTDLGAVQPTAAQIAAAKSMADAALEDLHGGKSLGRRRQDRLDRRLDRAVRPATSAGSRRTTSRPTRHYLKARLRRRGQQADGRHRGCRRHLPDRPGDRHRARGGRLRLPGQDRQRRHRPRQVPARRSRRTSCTRSSRSKIVADVHRRRAAAQRLGDLHQRGRAGPRPPTRSRSATSCTARRTTLRAPRRVPDTDPSWEAAQRRGPRRPTPACRTTRACSTRSPAKQSDEAQAPGPHRHRRQAPVLRQHERASTRSSRRRSSPPGLKDGAAPRAGQVRLRLARHPGHVPPDRRGPSQGAQDPGRQGRRLRRPRPRQLGRPDRGLRRRPRLDRQGPARRRADRRDLRGADRQDVRRS